ncbi:MAG: alpha-L-fucosidase, partial [Fibrobacteres bacterium]|nr:alpha-L-fucosidase [Fibrobacterota bacterium]
DAAKAAGMKYLNLTTKHHDGFCLWNSSYTAYDVGSSSWRGGNGDVVKEFADSARSRGLKVFFYYSIWDKTNGNDTTFIKNQLTELLTKYGAIDGLWFDGWGWKVGYAAVPYETIHRHIKSLQPNCLVMENNHQKTLYNTEITLYERNLDGIPSLNNLYPTEVCCNIRSDGKWFFSSGACNLRSLDYLWVSLRDVNASKANYLLDLTPDTAGLIPKCQVDLLREVSVFKPDSQMRNQDAALFYGTWSNSRNRPYGDYMDDLQYTRTPGDSFVFSFSGTSVEFITEQNSEHGDFLILIDGVVQDTARCGAATGIRSAQKVVFKATGLSAERQHFLKGVYIGTASKYGVVDAFRVSHDTLNVSLEQISSNVAKSHFFAKFVHSGRIIMFDKRLSGEKLVFFDISGKRLFHLYADINGNVYLPRIRPGVMVTKSKSLGVIKLLVIE